MFVMCKVLHFSCIPIPCKDLKCNDDDDDDDGIVTGTCNITYTVVPHCGLLYASKVNCINISDNVQ